MSTPLSSAQNGPTGRFCARRFLPLAVIAVGFVGFFAFGLDDYVSLEALRTHREDVLIWTHAHYPLALLAFFAAYVAVVALSLPVAVLFTPVAGFLFGTWVGASVSVVAATAGATIIFLAARFAAADVIKAKAGPRFRKMEDGFQENALSYLLVLRLVPLFPFWLVNLVPAVLGVRTGTYILGTAVGIVPGGVVYASVGNGLGAVFAEGGDLDMGVIFQPAVLLPLLGLAVLSLTPIAYKKWKKV